MCVLGKRLLKVDQMSDCHKESNGSLYRQFCPENKTLPCDPYWEKNDLAIVNGIKGLASGVIAGNIYSFIHIK